VPWRELGSRSIDHEEATEMEKLLLTPEEAANALGIGRRKVYELMAARKLFSVKIGASRRVPAEALRAFVASISEQAS
jgi:excisionase family DNA binding protein